MLQIENISVFYGDAQALFDISLRIEQGELVSLIGANGAGKSTIMNAVSGLIRVNMGKIIFKKQRIENLGSHKRVARGIILVPEGRKLFPDMTVLENLEMGAYHQKARLMFKESMDKVFNIFPTLGERKTQKAGTMSGGEQQMLTIARGLMGLPELLMFDELSLGLAPLLVRSFFKVTRELNYQGITIFLVEQNIKMALNISGRTYVLKEGRIVMEGQSRELINNEEVKMAYLGTINQKHPS